MFPALPLASFLEPRLAPWLFPFALYLAYCAGVIAHNHNHLPIFRQRSHNALYSAWLSFFYGCPLFVWIPTHNQNHHRYLDGPGDLARTVVHAERDRLAAWLSYPTRSSIAQLPAIVRFARDSRRGRRRRVVFETLSVVLGHALLLGLGLHLYGIGRGALLYALALGIPAGFASAAMMLTNYLQHVACDHASAHDHSRNFVSAWSNWLVFNAGYHTVHHEHPGTHWSLYPELHARRAGQIAPHLKQRTILGYVWTTYLAPRRDERRLRALQ